MLDFLEEGQLSGNLNEEEQAFLLELKKVRAAAAAELNVYYAEETERKLIQLKARIDAGSTDALIQNSGYSLWRKLSVAAVVLVGICLALYFNATDSGNSKAAKNILAGSHKAVLTLADGKILDLNDHKNGIVINESGLTYNDGTGILGTSADTGNVSLGVPEKIQLTTPKGGTYQVMLPDGTKVWLNASSVLKFPSTFKNLKERRVELQGEGYFQVVHNAKQPFRVQTNNQVVEDLGTEFNIDAYPDEPMTKTTLLEGIAKVYVAGKGQNKTSGQTNEVTLTPNQQAQLKYGAHDIKVQYINGTDAAAWKNGEFVFKSETLAEIMRKIERWYNVDVNYNSSLAGIKFSGAISRYDNLSKLLEMMELTGEVKFRITEKTITVTR